MGERSVFNSLKRNGYPGKFIADIKRKIKTRSNQVNKNGTKEDKGFAILPYIERNNRKTKVGVEW